MQTAWRWFAECSIFNNFISRAACGLSAWWAHSRIHIETQRRATTGMVGGGVGPPQLTTSPSHVTKLQGSGAVSTEPTAPPGAFRPQRMTQLNPETHLTSYWLSTASAHWVDSQWDGEVWFISALCVCGCKWPQQLRGWKKNSPQRLGGCGAPDLEGNVRSAHTYRKRTRIYRARQLKSSLEEKTPRKEEIIHLVSGQRRITQRHHTGCGSVAWERYVVQERTRSWWLLAHTSGWECPAAKVL